MVGHVLMHLSSSAMRTIIYMYLKKKPPGLQTVLDLLIMDILKVQMLVYSFFMTFLASGYFHGQLPYLFSQIMIFTQVNGGFYMFGLFQFFLMAKAAMIFKPSILNELSDSWLIGLSRIFATVYTVISFVGDCLILEAKPGVMTKFLTGTDAKS